MKNKEKENKRKKDVRSHRTRMKIFGNAKRPRASVSRSLKHISIQLIDDTRGVTLVQASDKEIKNSKKLKKVKIASEVGRLAGKKAADKKISQVIFDRGGLKYHGRIKALAEGMRESGIKF